MAGDDESRDIDLADGLEAEGDLDEELTEVDLDVEDLDEAIVGDIDEELVEDIDEDFEVLDEAATEAETDDDAEVEGSAGTARPATRADDEDEDEDLVSPDDVEADLDTILKDRLVAAEELEADDDEDEDTDDRSDGGDRIQRRRPGEFVCQSCFLLKPQGQLADPGHMLCRDCV